MMSLVQKVYVITLVSSNRNDERSAIGRQTKSKISKTHVDSKTSPPIHWGY